MEIIFALVFGLLIGSFLNVCIYRIPKKESIAFPPSYCPNCGEKIKPYDNIPVLSFILLRGQCRKCNSSISYQYPFVELINGVLFALLFIRYDLTFEFAVSAVFVSSLIVLTVIDYKHKILPNIITLPLIVFFTLMTLLNYLLNNNMDQLISSAYGLLLGGGILFLIALVSRGGMGGGDIKLGAMLGIVLGMKMVLFTLILSFIIGALVGIVLIIAGKKGRKDAVPFGPFLCFSAITALFHGTNILEWYIGFF